MSDYLWAFYVIARLVDNIRYDKDISENYIYAQQLTDEFFQSDFNDMDKPLSECAKNFLKTKGLF